MKKILWTSVFVFMVVFGGVYAKGPGMRQGPNVGPNAGMRAPKKRNNREFYAPWIIHMAGLETDLEKMRIEMQRIKLDSDEATFDLRNEQRKLRDRLENLVQSYDKNPGIFSKKITAVLKKIAANQDKIEKKRAEAMEKIRKLNDENRAKIKKKINAWLNQLDGNKDQMKRLVEIIKNTTRGPVGGYRK